MKHQRQKTIKLYSHHRKTQQKLRFLCCDILSQQKNWNYHDIKRNIKSCIQGNIIISINISNMYFRFWTTVKYIVLFQCVKVKLTLRNVDNCSPARNGSKFYLDVYQKKIKLRNLILSYAKVKGKWKKPKWQHKMPPKCSISQRIWTVSLRNIIM